MNQIMIIQSYWKHNTWCFSDESVGLKDEPFVAGADDIITALVRKHLVKTKITGINNVEINLMFSKDFFPDYDTILHHIGEQGSGNLYETIIDDVKYVGWLCPALLLYFSKAPETIYVKIKQTKHEKTEF